MNTTEYVIAVAGMRNSAGEAFCVSAIHLKAATGKGKTFSYRIYDKFPSSSDLAGLVFVS